MLSFLQRLVSCPQYMPGIEATLLLHIITALFSRSVHYVRKQLTNMSFAPEMYSDITLCPNIQISRPKSRRRELNRYVSNQDVFSLAQYNRNKFCTLY